MTTRQDDRHDAQDPHGYHRFLLIGKATVFAYHLALYHQPAHAYQMIAKIRLTDEVRTAYLEDLAENEDERVFYSLYSPEHFPLSDIPNGNKPSFDVILERVVVDPDGNRKFEPMLDGRTTKANCPPQDVQHFRQLGGTGYPYALTYLLFGQGEETHLAHRLAQHPNWDEVITITDPLGHPLNIEQAVMDQVPDTIVLGIEDPHEVVTTSPLPIGKVYKARIAEDAGEVDFQVGRQGWWNHTSLNDS
ncbi:hypothetical protein I5Q34_03010 [Streptomyces sp. AV19]|uniref:hypothetical protein n=1 Tax=Streptomyces sp. AV19 TaxID=2793068 RepID=UPI0018FED6F0|nr:hypothetical protein [Streptomyces sp. AV19]MBH1933267.1 hypothetical protein [Streptomyces sp. AV19]MDG4536158.1 hypothetical protein [Streptomyces sp. AV19]